MSFIEKNPEKHDQTHWVNDCGTAFCYAGHAAILSGATLPPPNVSAWARHWVIDRTSLISVSLSTFDFGSHDGIVPIHEFAAERLGITEAEADVLFDGDRTIAELRALVDALCSGAWIEDDSIYVDGERYGYVDVWLEETSVEA